MCRTTAGVSPSWPTRPDAISRDDDGELTMFRVTREIEFCYGHRLLNYEGKCRHLHGHNGLAVIAIEGSKLDERGMLVDFGDIKSAVSTWIDDHLDHRMLLRRDDPVVPILEKMGEPMYLLDEN